MSVYQFVPSIDNSLGGPSRSATHLAISLAQQNTLDKYELITGICPNPLIQGSPLKNFKLTFIKRTYLGRFEKLKLKNSIKSKGLLHGHGVWDLPIHQMAVLARKLNFLYLISPRGMLEPWSLGQKRWKKKLALWLYQLKDMKEAACLHATAPMEAANLRALGLENPIAVIPNGIPLEDYPVKDNSIAGGKRQMLFLSRLHPKKGLEILIEAWAALPVTIREAWELRIAGNGPEEYIRKLERETAMRRCCDSVKFLGPLYGEDKIKAYQQASLFVLPTFSENFGIVVAEALACGTPVITTQGAPWQDLVTYNSGWWIPTGFTVLKDILEQSLNLPEEVLYEMGQNGRKLVEQKYSMAAVATQMQLVYDWLLGRGPQPEFVFTGDINLEPAHESWQSTTIN